MVLVWGKGLEEGVGQVGMKGEEAEAVAGTSMF